MIPLLPRRSILLGAAAALLAPRAVAADDLLPRIVAARAALQTLRASFTQERTLGLLATAVTSHGDLALVKPDYLRWRLDPPDDITWWVTPGSLSYASKTSRGTVARDAAGSMGVLLGDLLAVVSGDIGTLRARYRLTSSLTSQGANVTAEPVDPSARIKRIKLQLAPDLVTPRSVELVESESDASRIRFEAVKLNEPIDPLIMRPPADPAAH